MSMRDQIMNTPGSQSERRTVSISALDQSKQAILYQMLVSYRQMLMGQIDLFNTMVGLFEEQELTQVNELPKVSEVDPASIETMGQDV